jgi:hypothetical protein
MFILMATESYKVPRMGGIQWHDIYTEFHKKWSLSIHNIDICD